MTFSRLTQIQMLDWLRNCVEAETPMPDDAAICERFELASPDRARALLADLAERKEITIKGYGDNRVITLGKTPVAAPASPRPVPTVVKRDTSVERTAEKIVSIVKREAKASTPAVPPAQDSGDQAPVKAPDYIGTNDELAALIGKLVSELAGRAQQSVELAVLRRERDAALARAEAAEAKLAIARQALAA